MTVELLSCGKNPYIDFEGVSNRKIETLMKNGNLWITKKDFSKLEISLLKLFGLGNVSHKPDSENYGYIVSITKTGREHCLKMQEIIKYEQEQQELEKKQEETAVKVFNERWGISDE